MEYKTKRKNKERRNWKRILGLLSISLFGMIVLGITIFWDNPECSNMPDVVEYPNAQIVSVNGSSFTYETTDSYEDVRNFYLANMVQCHDFSFSTGLLTQCERNPETYFSYVVALDEDFNTPYLYSMRLVWNKNCRDINPYPERLRGYR